MCVTTRFYGLATRIVAKEEDRVIRWANYWDGYVKSLVTRSSDC